MEFTRIGNRQTVEGTIIAPQEGHKNPRLDLGDGGKKIALMPSDPLTERAAKKLIGSSVKVNLQELRPNAKCIPTDRFARVYSITRDRTKATLEGKVTLDEKKPYDKKFMMGDVELEAVGTAFVGLKAAADGQYSVRLHGSWDDGGEVGGRVFKVRTVEKIEDAPESRQEMAEKLLARFLKQGDTPVVHSEKLVDRKVKPEEVGLNEAGEPVIRAREAKVYFVQGAGYVADVLVGQKPPKGPTHQYFLLQQILGKSPANVKMSAEKALQHFLKTGDAPATLDILARVNEPTMVDGMRFTGYVVDGKVFAFRPTDPKAKYGDLYFANIDYTSRQETTDMPRKGFVLLTGLGEKL